jgi:hypothetical protein
VRERCEVLHRTFENDRPARPFVLIVDPPEQKATGRCQLGFLARFEQDVALYRNLGERGLNVASFHCVFDALLDRTYFLIDFAQRAALRRRGITALVQLIFAERNEFGVVLEPRLQLAKESLIAFLLFLELGVRR